MEEYPLIELLRMLDQVNDDIEVSEVNPCVSSITHHEQIEQRKEIKETLIPYLN